MNDIFPGTNPVYPYGAAPSFIDENNYDSYFLEQNLQQYATPQQPSISETLSTPRLPNIVPYAEIEHERLESPDPPSIQTFYEGPRKCDCCTNWIEKQPVQMPDHARKKYSAAAIIVYKKKDHKAEKSVVGGLVTMKFSAVEIQSPILVDHLKPILREYDEEPTAKGKFYIKAPFRELFFAYPKLEALCQGDRSEMEKEHLKALISVMDDLFSDISADVRALHAKRMITEQYLWTIFPKNIIVISSQYGRDRLFRVSSFSFQLECDYHLFDGTTFGEGTINFNIPSFTGARPISSLPVYPIGFHEDPHIENRIFQRSTKVLKCQRNVHCEYEGIALTSTSSASAQNQRHVCGRIVIDAFCMRRFATSFVDELSMISINKSQAKDPESIVTEHLRLPLAHLDSSNKRRPTLPEQQQAIDLMMQNRNHVLILSPYLPGYSLTHNEWFWFSIDNLRPTVWNEDVYDRLVFPETQKNLLLNCVRHHAQTSKLSDDIIAGKGRGLVILLSGPPGTGKTLTAEALAENLKWPLLRLQASSFGDPRGITALLRNSFELSEEWNSMLPIDEADDFISTRSQVGDFANGVLRHIEYFKGVLFLTANLHSTLDEAFRSRLHIHLRYETLPWSSRIKIWKTFVSRIEQAVAASKLRSPSQPVLMTNVKISDEDVGKLANWQLNGREIKNIVKTTFLNCVASKKDLDFESLRSGIQITSPFAEEIGVLPLSENGTGCVQGLPAFSTQVDKDNPRKRRRLSD